MARGRSRWGNRDLRHVFPLPSERQAQPRFDGLYEHESGGHLRFAADRTVQWSDEPGEWSVDNGLLRVVTSTRDCEGAVDRDTVYLVCVEGPKGRSQCVLTFRADG